jgi:hypothetical protein
MSGSVSSFRTGLDEARPMLGPWLHHQRREAAEAVIDLKTLSALFRWFRHTPQRGASPRSEVNGSSGSEEALSLSS